MNIVTIKINGNEYNLKGEEREEYLHVVASYVDKKIKNIMDNNSKLSTSSAAILTALNLGDDMFKSQSLCKELSNKLEQLEHRDRELREQFEIVKKQLKHMEAYNEELLNKYKNLADNDYIKKVELENNKLQQQLNVMQDSTKNCMAENTRVKSENKEMKFQIQSSKYKIIDLQNKLIEYQISLAKQKKINNPLLTQDKAHSNK